METAFRLASVDSKPACVAVTVWPEGFDCDAGSVGFC